MTFVRVALAAALLSAGCSAQISDGRGVNLDGVDASVAADAAVTALCGRRTVYLNFEGQRLVQGTSDATKNQAEWMQILEGTAPPYLAGKPNRDAKIQAIVDGLRAQLSRFPIRVVTTRPTGGDYVMIVLGGQAADVGSRFGAAVNQLDCGDARPSDVAWISDDVTPQQAVINTAIGAIGFGLGLTATSDPKDCMCSWANNCNPDDTVACTLGSPVVRDPLANQRCEGAAAQQDEVAVFRTAFCGLP